MKSTFQILSIFFSILGYLNIAHTLIFQVAARNKAFIWIDPSPVNRSASSILTLFMLAFLCVALNEMVPVLKRWIKKVTS